MGQAVRSQINEVKGTLSAQLNESDATTYVGPIRLLGGGMVNISGTWEGTLALQRQSTADETWVSEATWTSNPSQAQAIDCIIHGDWRVTFTTLSSGSATVYLISRKHQ